MDKIKTPVTLWRFVTGITTGNGRLKKTGFAFLTLMAYL